MRNLIQSLALAGYRLLYNSGLLRFPVVRRGFEISYDLYKSKVEARQIGRLRGFVRPDTVVIDVGANIGFFTGRFARWISGAGRVIAIEPDRDNFRRLGLALARRRLTAVVDLLEGAAADIDGTLNLVLNPYHPADHRLGAEGVPVAAFTLDRILAERGWPSVSLVKIDVQGAEIRVLEGARALLSRDHPVIYIELDDKALESMGGSADRVIDLLAGFGYEMYDLDAPGDGRIDRADAAKRRASVGYGDFLFKTAESAAP